MGVPRDVGTGAASVVVDDLADSAVRDACHRGPGRQRRRDPAPLPRRSTVAAGRAAPGDRRSRPPASTSCRCTSAPRCAGVGVDDLMRAIPWLLPSTDVTTAGPASANGVQDRARTEPREDRLRAHLHRDAADPRSRAARRRHDGPHDRHRHRGLRRAARRRRRRPRTPARSPRSTASSTARIGDTFGPSARTVEHPAFAPPAMETAVVPRHHGDKRAVFDALTDLAEQDPLINLRQDDTRQELFLSLYGEVQKEIVAQTLAARLRTGGRVPPDDARVHRATEPQRRPPSSCSRRRRTPTHPFLATVGLAISPSPPGSGVTFELDGRRHVHPHPRLRQRRRVPRRSWSEPSRDTLRQGLHGWEVTDCRVVMTDCDYQAPPRKWPGTTLSDYRLLTPLVLMSRAGAGRHDRARTRPPVPPRGPARRPRPGHGAAPRARRPPRQPDDARIDRRARGVIRVARLHQLQTRLPDLTRGEGVLESVLAGHQPVGGAPPSRPRTDRNPLDRHDYLRRVSHGT